MCGVGFAGKSTLAKKISDYKKAILVSQDGIWFEKEKELNLGLDSDEDWETVRKISKERIIKELEKGNSVVFDDVNLRYDHREELRNLAKKFNVQAVVVYLDTSLEIQKERQTKNLDTKERHDVKQEYLDEAIKELEIPREDENVFVFKLDTNIENFLRKLP
jgi:predicted kinase